jgi:putative transcription antitermination factor YqgF
MTKIYRPILYKSMNDFINQGIFCNKTSAKQCINKITGEIMALDVGTRYTGIAISMKHFKYPRSVDTLRHYNNQRLFHSKNKILNLMDTHNVNSIVVGWPLNYDDIEPEGKQCQFVLNSILELCETNVKFHDIPILLQDETSTTREVRESGIENIFGKSNIKEKGIIDQMVAINLLKCVLLNVQGKLSRV